MPTLYLNTYGPLVTSPAGRRASEKYRIPPFVDGSIRREPDLEHQYPSISCLCRGGQFAPRLRVGDIVVYMTKKGRYHPIPARHRRLAAILRVVEVFESHSVAAAWYKEHDLPLPNNCMVPGNTAKPLDQSNRMHKSEPSAGCAI